MIFLLAVFLTGILCAAEYTRPSELEEEAQSWPQCFTPEEQLNILGVLDQKKSHRTTPPIRVFEFKGNYGGILTLHLARIILEELMGYDVTLQLFDGELDEASVFKRLVDRETDVMLEVAVDVDNSKSYHDTVDEDPLKPPTVVDGAQLGVTQQEGLYTTLSMGYDKGSCSLPPDFWRSYNSSELLANLNQSLRVGGDFPRHVPPQCAGVNEQYCVELLGTNNVSGASLMSMIRVNNWNMTVAWVGDNITDIVEERLQMGDPVLFFYYEPSRFITQLGTNVTRVTLPTFTTECLQQKCDPRAPPLDCLQKPNFGKMVYCDYRPYPVHKLYSVGWVNISEVGLTDAVLFLRQFSVFNSEQEAMLLALNSSTMQNEEMLSAAFAEIACRWLRYSRAHRKFGMTPMAVSHQLSDPIILPPRWFSFVFNTQRITRNLISHELAVVVSIVVGIFILGSCILQIILIYFQSSPVVKASSYRLCHCMIVGSYLVYASVLIGGLWPQTQSDYRACIVAPTIFGMGYMMMLGAVALKNWRIHRIFNYAKVGNRPPSDAALLGWLMTFVAGEVVFDVMWFFFAEPPALQTVSTRDFLHPLDDTVSCGFGSNVAISFIPKILLLAWSCYIGFRVRNVRHNFNESQKMAFASYAVFMELVFSFLLTYLDLDPTLEYVVVGALICFGSVNALVILFFPKLWSIWRIRQISNAALNQTLLDNHSKQPSLKASAQSSESLEQLTGVFKDQDYDLVGELVSVRTQLECAMKEINRLKRGSVVAPMLVPDGLSKNSMFDMSSENSDELMDQFGSIPSLGRSYTAGKALSGH